MGKDRLLKFAENIVEWEIFVMLVEIDSVSKIQKEMRS
jgi:hypothetical protein